MFKFLTISLQIILVILIALVILNYSFVISFEINDFIYSIPSTFLFVFLLIFFLLIFLIQSLYFKTKFKFSNYKVNKIIQKKEKGYNAFVNGMIALANRDFKKAINESKKTSNYLRDDLALTLLLKSEVYKIEKKFDDLRILVLGGSQGIKRKTDSGPRFDWLRFVLEFLDILLQILSTFNFN